MKEVTYTKATHGYYRRDNNRYTRTQQCCNGHLKPKGACVLTIHKPTAAWMWSCCFNSLHFGATN